MGLVDPPPSTGGGSTHTVGEELAWEEEDGDGVPKLPSSEGYPFWAEHDTSILLEIQRPETLQS
jgi:hypothetical protein